MACLPKRVERETEGERGGILFSKAAMDLCICSNSLQSDHQIWAMNFSDWNECRVSLEQDNLLSPDFKLLLFICLA